MYAHFVGVGRQRFGFASVSKVEGKFCFEQPGWMNLFGREMFAGTNPDHFCVRRARPKDSNPKPTAARRPFPVWAKNLKWIGKPAANQALDFVTKSLATLLRFFGLLFFLHKACPA